jgi:hypothetical protein
VGLFTSVSKASGANDALHHFVVAINQTTALGGTNSLYIQLVDGAANQCGINFRSDGAITLTSGAFNGTVIATYANAFPAANAWFAFEIEVFISSTSGYMNVRKGGNPANDFTSATNLNTRAGSTNNYANKILVALNGNYNVWIDDFLWRSDASSVPWVGDVRCYTRAPASDASIQFAHTPATFTVTQNTNTSFTDANTISRYSPLVASYTGTVGTATLGVGTAFTGNCKMSIFADIAAGGGPGAVLGSATPIVNPILGVNTFTFPSPVSVVKGATYWIGVSHDVSANLNYLSVSTNARQSTAVSYASFPVASPTTTTGIAPVGVSIVITVSTNYDYVNETLQDAAATYVYDSTVGHADFYPIAALPATPASVVAVITRGFMQKSDAGFRSGTVQLKSGATTVAAPTSNLSTSFLWVWRADTLDPATGAAWTPIAVNNVQIGPLVVG